MADFTKIKKLYHITESKGFNQDKINSASSVFGMLPQVLKDYYMELGGYGFNQSQDRLVLPCESKDKEYLIFYAENQYVCVWAIHKDDVSKTNPPVYMSRDENEWNVECETLTEFLEAMAYLQSVFWLDYRPDTYFELEEEDYDLIKNMYQKKSVSFCQWADGIEFYGNEEDSVIAILWIKWKGKQMLYASQNKSYFEEMDKVLSELGSEI